MSTEPPVLPPPLPPKKPLATALILAFTPTILALFIASIQPPKDKLMPCLVIGTILSLACCGASSYMLIRRNTTGALVFGILLGMLNLLISAGFGCVALLSDINVR